MRAPVPIALCLVVAACGARGWGPIGSGDTDDATPDHPADTDPAADTDPVTDSDPRHTGAADTDPADTDPPPRAPPTTWGGGLVDLSTARFAAEGVVAFLGNPATHEGPQAAYAVFADLDGDGRPEVVVDTSRYSAESQPRTLRVFRYDRTTGQLVRDASLEGLFPGMADQAFLGGLDLDGDGLDDLVQESGDLVWWADGAGAFVRGPALQHGERLSRPTYTTLSVLDADADGWLDLLVGSDHCQWSYRVLQRTGVRTFDARDDLIDPTPPMRLTRASSMRLADGSPGILTLGTACSPGAPTVGGFLVRAPVGAADGTPRWQDQDLTPADAHWKLSPMFAGLPFTTVMPMGALSADMDGDLLPDLLLALGYDALGSLRGLPGGGYADATRLAFTRTAGVLEVPWGLAAPDLDRDGVPDLVIAMGDDATSFHGFAGVGFPPRVYWGWGGLDFADVTTDIGATAAGSWHGLSLDDLDGDADPDIAVGGYGNAPLVWRNDVDLGHHTLAIRLHGTTSNPLGFGAVVELESSGLPRRAQVVGGEASPDALPRGVVFFGLGDHTVADLVRVRWPSGVVQELRGLAADQAWDLTEPPSVVVSEADRHLPADGTSTVTVDVWPRDPTGAVTSAGTVTLSLGGTPVVVREPPALQRDGSWRAVLQAPLAAGSTRVEAQVDGVPYAVAPRVWWD